MTTTRWPFPQDRTAFRFAGPGSPLYAPSADRVTVYTDAACTVLADIQTAGGVPVAGSVLTTGIDTLIPVFLGPATDARVLYGRTSAGVFEMDARVEDRMNALQAQLVLKPWEFSVAAYGALGDGVTDDTGAINAAVAAAWAYAVANNGYARVVFPVAAVDYLVNGAPSHAYSGNAIIPVPGIRATTANKINLEFTGAAQGAALPHWQQTVRQVNPVTLRTTNSYPMDSTYGEPAILGGPNFHQGYGGGGDVFNNVCVSLDGLSFMGPNTPAAGISGVDLVGCAESHVKTGSYLVNNPPGAGLAPGSPSGYAFGLRTPNNGNNDLSVVESWSTEGLTFGMQLGEHTSVLASRVVYCNIGYAVIGSYGGVGAQHSVALVNASAEGCTVHLKTVGDNARVHGLIDIEDTAAVVIDGYATTPASGDLWVTGAYTTLVVPAAGSNLRVRNTMAPPGFLASAPPVPSTAVALQNPTGRDAWIVVSGGAVTAIAVDGHATGLTSGQLLVPMGKTVTLTYSAAPTWNWWLI